MNKEEEISSLNEKIENSSDFFLIYGWVKRIEELESK